MSNKIIDVRKVARLKQLIERQIQLRVEQLATFVRLKQSIDHRMFRGQLLDGDLDMIRDKLKEMPGSSYTAATDHVAMEAIQHLLDGKEWSSDTLGEIARIVKNAGYQVRDVDASAFEAGLASVDPLSDRRHEEH